MGSKIFITNSKDDISEEIHRTYSLIIYVCKDSAENTHYVTVKNRYGEHFDLIFRPAMMALLDEYLQMTPIENPYRTSIS